MWNIGEFLDYIEFEKAYSKDTVNAYSKDLTQFRTYCNGEGDEIGVDNVDSLMIRGWMTELMDAGYTASSVNRKLSTLRSFFKYLLRHGNIELDPTRKIVGPKKKKVLPVYLKESEMNRLLDDFDYDEGFKGVRDKMIVEMFYLTGIRLSELVNLKISDVDFSASVLKIKGKRNKQRLVPFVEELATSMKRYIDMRKDVVGENVSSFFVREDGQGVTVGNVYDIVKTCLSKVSTNKKRSPHVLRHTFATTMLNNDADLSTIGKILGHESLATTEVYTHTTFEELKKSYNQAHPRA